MASGFLMKVYDSSKGRILSQMEFLYFVLNLFSVLGLHENILKSGGPNGVRQVQLKGVQILIYAITRPMELCILIQSISMSIKFT